MDKVIQSGQEIWPGSLSGAKYGLTVITVSSVLFYICGLIAVQITPKTAEKQEWRWKNISVSFVHSIISGVWAVCSFIDEPRMAQDTIMTYTVMGHTVISLSVGYFIYDAVDMLRYQRDRTSVELLLHHAVVIFCFGIPVCTKMYVPYCLLALFVEVNGVFLHIRQLLQCCGYTKSDSIYRINSVINLVTFVVFRMLTLAWMTWWAVIYKNLMPIVIHTILSVGIAIMTVINVVLFYRLLQSDFLRTKKQSRTKDQ